MLKHPQLYPHLYGHTVLRKCGRFYITEKSRSQHRWSTASPSWWNACNAVTLWQVPHSLCRFQVVAVEAVDLTSHYILTTRLQVVSHFRCKFQYLAWRIFLSIFMNGFYSTQSQVPHIKCRLQVMTRRPPLLSRVNFIFFLTEAP